jgi:L-lactate dehydrogenase complex protein LldG
VTTTPQRPRPSGRRRRAAPLDARAEILARVREAVARPVLHGAGAAPGPAAPATVPTGPTGTPATQRAPAEPPREYRRRGEHDPGSQALLDLLVDRLVDYGAGVVRVRDDAALPAGLSGLLTEGGVRTLVVPPWLPSAWVTAAGVAGAEVLTDAPGAPLDAAALDGVDAVLTACRVAIAETGTIVLDGEGDQGRRAITLVPDRHVCVVRAAQVVQTVPEGVDVLLRAPDRPLTWISGPSATSDIELSRVEGVHGPRTLDVVLVGPASDAAGRR